MDVNRTLETPGPPTYSERNELAKSRNRAAAERTLMAWVRTSLSLIGFGFGIERIVEAIAPRASSNGLTPFVTLSFIALGIYGLIAASRRYRSEIRSLEQGRYAFTPHTSPALIVAVILAVVGAVAFLGLLLRLMPRM